MDSSEFVEILSEVTAKTPEKCEINNPVCGICGANHFPMDCNVIRVVSHIPDKPIPSKARLTLPDDLEIRTMADETQTVVASYYIEKGIQFGPVQAKKLCTLLPAINFPLKLFCNSEDEFSEYFLDTSNENECSWMMFIAAASSIEEQNLICYQDGDDLYYVTIRDILEGEQLKVWYSPYYATKMQKSLLMPTIQQDESNITDLAVVTEATENLVRNKKTVTKRDTWCCKYCGRVDKSLAEFALHLVGHYRAKSGRFCQFCNTTFRTAKGCQKHKKIVHSEDSSKKSEPEADLSQNNSQLKMSKDNPLEGPLLSDNITIDSLDNPSLLLPQNYLIEFSLENIENQNHLLGNENLQLNSESIMNMDQFDFELKEPENDQLMCDICLKSFKKLRQLLLHMAQHTGRFSCHDCNKMFARKENFQFHVCNSYYKIKCTLCDKLFFQKKYLTQHLKQAHTFTCKWCHNSHESKEHLKNHACSKKPQSPDKKKTFPCTKCSKQFTLMKNLRVHLRNHDLPKERYTCPTCGMVLNSRKCYLKHLKLHEGNVHQCDQCQKVFTRKDTLKEHQKKTHFREEATCEICKKVVKSKKLLKHHMETHKEKGLKCPECPAAFKQNKNLKRHIKLCHAVNITFESFFTETEKPYSCPKCDKKMKHSHSVKRHIERFHPDFEYSYESVKRKRVKDKKMNELENVDKDPLLDLKETIENMNFSFDDIPCINTEMNMEIDKLLNNPENFSSDTNDILVDSLINSVVKGADYSNKPLSFKEKEVFLSMPDLDLDDNMSLENKPFLVENSENKSSELDREPF
nr:PR domain zinc finger protein 15-like [Leptinotarsa decemlineata]